MTPIQITGTLGLGEKATISFEDLNGFKPEDKIAFVDANGKWTLVSSTLSPDEKSLTSTVDHFSIWAPVDQFETLLITATPVWSEEGYIPNFMPADRYSGLVIYYDALTTRIITDNDMAFIHFDESDDPQTIASNNVTSIAVDGDDEDIGVILIGTYGARGGGVSYPVDGV